MQGLHSYRCDNNPLEKAFDDEWVKQNKQSHTLEYLLSPDANKQHCGGILQDPVSERDEIVAATIIQWLGSPVGLSFVTEVLTKNGFVVETKYHNSWYSK